MNFYEQLLQATNHARQQMLSIPLIQAGLSGKVTLASYIAFLTEAYHHVKHTIPLLMACGSRVPLEPRWMREAIIEYIEEEKNHELWILNDIAACGADANAVRFGLPKAETELMVAYAYYSIERINPLCFFGMVLVLEGTSIAVATQAATAIKQHLQLPDSAFSYLVSHGALDIEHMGFYRTLMEQVDNPKDQHDIINCANLMYSLYGNVLRSVPLEQTS